MVFHKAIERAEKSDDVNQRVKNLIDSITYSVFMYTTRGLFERDKLTFTSQVTFQVSSLDNTLYVSNQGPVMTLGYPVYKYVIYSKVMRLIRVG